MAIEFSLEKDVSLFGLNVPLEIYQQKLASANAFYALWKQVDQNQTLLKTSTKIKFGKSRAKGTFTQNVMKIVQNDEDGEALLPLLTSVPTEVLMVVLYSLTPSHLENLKNNHLLPILPELIKRVIGECHLSSEVKQECTNIIHDICDQNVTKNGATFRSKFVARCLFSRISNSSRFFKRSSQQEAAIGFFTRSSQQEAAIGFFTRSSQQEAAIGFFTRSSQQEAAIGCAS
jgi:hypothetical protein